MAHRRYPRHMEFHIPAPQPSPVKLDLGDAMVELKQLDPDGWESWYDAVVPEELSFADILPIVRERVERLKAEQQEWLALSIVAAYVPPEPETVGDATALVYMEPPAPEFGSAQWFSELPEVEF